MEFCKKDSQDESKKMDGIKSSAQGLVYGQQDLAAADYDSKMDFVDNEGDTPAHTSRLTSIKTCNITNVDMTVNAEKLRMKQVVENKTNVTGRQGNGKPEFKPMSSNEAVPLGSEQMEVAEVDEKSTAETHRATTVSDAVNDSTCLFMKSDEQVADNMPIPTKHLMLTPSSIENSSLWTENSITLPAKEARESIALSEPDGVVSLAEVAKSNVMCPPVLPGRSRKIADFDKSYACTREQANTTFTDEVGQNLGVVMPGQEEDYTPGVKQTIQDDNSSIKSDVLVKTVASNSSNLDSKTVGQRKDQGNDQMEHICQTGPTSDCGENLTAFQSDVDEPAAYISSKGSSLVLDIGKDADVELPKIAVVKLVRCAATEEDIANALQDLQQLEDRNMKRNYRQHFGCYECSLRFHNVNTVIEHGLECHNIELSAERILDLSSGCSFCGKKFHHCDSLRKHEQMCAKHARATPLVCTLCKRLFSRKAGLFSHLRWVHGVKPTQEHFRAKRTFQSDANVPKCILCSYTFASWKEMHKHKRKCHSKTALRHRRAKVSKPAAGSVHCLVCGRKFVTRSQLFHHQKVAHQRITSKPKSNTVISQEPRALRTDMYSCHLCGISMLGASIAKHLRNIHRTTLSVISLRRASRKKFQGSTQSCIYCNERFSKKSIKRYYIHLISQHKDMHDTRSSHVYKCKTCALVFLNRLQLNHHIKVKRCYSQTTTLPASVDDQSDLVFPCTKCGQVLSGLTSLDRHMLNVHYGKDAQGVVIKGVPRASAKEPTPDCKQCGVLFESWSNLYSHLRKAECQKSNESQPVVKAMCTDCNLSFRNQRRLDCHNQFFHKNRSAANRAKETSTPLVCATSAKPYICSLCDKEFKTEEIWIKHLRKIHRLIDKKCDAMREQVRLERATEVHESKTSAELLSDSATNSKSADSVVAKSSCALIKKAVSSASSSTEVYSCTFCDMSYHTSQSLARHYRERHKQHLKPTVQNSSQKAKTVRSSRRRVKVAGLLSCHICDVSTPYKNNLVRHYVKTHKLSRLESKQIVYPSPEKSNQQLGTTEPLVKNENSLCAADYSSDSSSTSNDSWMPAHMSSSSTSTDSSSSDDSEMDIVRPIFAPQRPRFVSSSSSSSSSDDSFQDLKDVQAMTVEDSAAILDRVVDPLKQVAEVGIVSENTALDNKSASLNDQLLFAEVLELDKNIFNVHQKGTEKLQKTSVSETIPPKEKTPNAATACKSQETKIETADDKCEKQPLESPCDLIDDQNINSNESSCTSDNAIDNSHSHTVASSVDDSPTISANEAVVEVNSGKDNISCSLNLTEQAGKLSAIDASENSSVVGLIHSPFGKVVKYESKEKLGRKELCIQTSLAVNAPTKSTPVAILRPFSSVPEKKSPQPDACVDSSQTLAHDLSAATKVSVSADGNLGTSHNGSSSTQSLQTPTTSVSSMNIPSPLSYPVYLVGTKDIIVPFVTRDVYTLYTYRRIRLPIKDRYPFEFIFQWYGDFSLHPWHAIALLPEPLQCTSHIQQFMAWLLKNKNSCLKSQSAPSVLPRIAAVNWVDQPEISMVKSYRTVKYSALCCLCGIIVRDLDQLNNHSFKGHPLCTQCGQFFSPQEVHRCSESASNIQLPPPNVKFITLSSASSRTCVPISAPVISRKVVNAKERALPLQSLQPIAIQPKPAHSPMMRFPVKPVTLPKSDTNAFQDGKVVQEEDSKHAQMSITNEHMHVVDKPGEKDLGKQNAKAGALSLKVSSNAEPQKLDKNQDAALKPEHTTSHTAQPAKQSNDTGNAKTLNSEVDQKADSQLKNRFSHQDFLKANSHPYKCSFCSIQFAFKVQLEHHQQTLHKKCTLCPRLFRDRQHRSDHISQEHGSFICLACDHTCSTDQAIKGHIIRDHVDMETGLFNCASCQKKPVHPEAIVQHLKDDDLELNRKCHLCGYVLPLEEKEKLEHFFTHALYTSNAYCLACSKLFLEPWALRAHMLKQKHPSCGYCLYTDVLSSDHQCPSVSSDSIHPRVLQEAKKITNKIAQFGRYCSTCFQTVHDMSLKQHCDTKHSEYRLQCEICGQRFEFDHQKAFHMGVHKKKKHWKCSMCSVCLLVSISQETGDLKQQPYAVHITTCCQCQKMTTSLDSCTETMMEVSVSVENVESCADDSGDVQLMLDGKLYNFIPEENHKASSPQQSNSRVCEAVSTSSIEVVEDNVEDDKLESSDDESVVLVIDDTGVADVIGSEPTKTSDSSSANMKHSLSTARLVCDHCTFSCKFKAAMNKHMQKKHGL